MKKLIIPAAFALIAACTLPFIKKTVETKANQNGKPTQNYISQDQNETTRAFHPQFTALNIPNEMKQNFRINPNAGQIIVGNSGTMLTVPDHAFRFANGNSVKGKVKLELVEGIKNADILKMNLGTMSDEGILQTGGMISVNAFSDSGDTLKLADGKELQVEIPTTNKKEGMKLWDGVVQNDGSVSWTNPQPLNENLRAIPAEALDTAVKIKPEHKDVMQEKAIFPRADFRMGEIVNGVYLFDSSWVEFWDATNNVWVKKNPTDTNTIVAASSDGKSIEVLSLTDKKFTNTNIATEEFRSRIPFINQCCDARIMSCYTNFPQRSLWKSDLAAADSLDQEGCQLADLFRQFANLKEGKVDPKDPKTTEALNSAREKAIKNYSHNVHEAEKMYSFSFGMKKLGWANVDRLCNPSGEKTFFNVRVDNSDNNVFVTLIVPGKDLFINAYRRPNGDYSFTHGEFEQTAAFPQGENALLLARSGEGKNLKFVLQKIILGTNPIEQLKLHAGTENEMTLALGNQPEPEKDEPEKIIDDWYTRQIKSGGGCLCNAMVRE